MGPGRAGDVLFRSSTSSLTVGREECPLQNGRPADWGGAAFPLAAPQLWGSCVPCYSAAGKDQRPFQGKEKEGTRPDSTAGKPAFSTQNVGCSKRRFRGIAELRALVLGASYSPHWSVRLT